MVPFPALSSPELPVPSATTGEDGSYTFSGAEASSSAYLLVSANGQTIGRDPGSGYFTVPASGSGAATVDRGASAVTPPSFRVTLVSPERGTDLDQDSVEFTFQFNAPVAEAPFTSTDAPFGNGTMRGVLNVKRVGPKRRVSGDLELGLSSNDDRTELTVSTVDSLRDGSEYEFDARAFGDDRFESAYGQSVANASNFSGGYNEKHLKVRAISINNVRGEFSNTLTIADQNRLDVRSASIEDADDDGEDELVAEFNEPVATGSISAGVFTVLRDGSELSGLIQGAERPPFTGEKVVLEISDSYTPNDGFSNDELRVPTPAALPIWPATALTTTGARTSSAFHRRHRRSPPRGPSSRQAGSDMSGSPHEGAASRRRPFHFHSRGFRSTDDDRAAETSIHSGRVPCCPGAPQSP